jgi:hypothetical protein
MDIEFDSGGAKQFRSAWRGRGEDHAHGRNAILAGVIAVQQFMPDAVAEILRKAPLTPEKVAFAWRSAVGSAVDKASTIELRNGVLQVRARDASWQREMERSAAVIRARLDALLGPGVVRYVDVTVARLPGSG